jgi:proteic killer suppression protein
VTYATNRLKTCCSTFDLMRKAWGVDVAKALAQRIKQMDAADTADDLLLLPGKWERLRGNRSHQMSARLSPNWRLIVEPGDGGQIELIGLEDYH